MKTASIVLGIAYLIIGIICLAAPYSVASVLTFVLAFAVLLVGVWVIVTYFIKKNSFAGLSSGWSLFYGIVIVLLGLILMFNTHLSEAIIAVLIEVWVLVSGIMRIANAVKLKRLAEPWGTVMATGILSVVLAVFLMLHPVLTFISLGICIAVSLISEGIGLILLGCKL